MGWHIITTSRIGLLYTKNVIRKYNLWQRFFLEVIWSKCLQTKLFGGMFFVRITELLLSLPIWWHILLLDCYTDYKFYYKKECHFCREEVVVLQHWLKTGICNTDSNNNWAVRCKVIKPRAKLGWGPQNAGQKICNQVQLCWSSKDVCN